MCCSIRMKMKVNFIWRQICSSTQAKHTCTWSPVYLKHWFWEFSQWCLRLEDLEQILALSLQEKINPECFVKEQAADIHMNTWKKSKSLSDLNEDFSGYDIHIVLHWPKSQMGHVLLMQITYFCFCCCFLWKIYEYYAIKRNKCYQISDVYLTELN